MFQPWQLRDIEEKQYFHKQQEKKRESVKGNKKHVQGNIGNNIGKSFKKANSTAIQKKANISERHISSI